MKYQYLSETVTIKKVSEDVRRGVFEIEGLYTGYGLTLGNSLRRVLLSSLPGTAITQIKIKNVNHEFSTLPGVVEDMLDITLNLKKIRFHSFTEEPQVLLLKVKGEHNVTAADIKLNSEIEIINPEAHIATLSLKNAELDMELTVEKGLGYSPVEVRKMEKLGVGVIAIDTLFSPVQRVNYVVENMRVGERTDYNKVRLEIETDGTISPSAALHKAANILKDHYEKLSVVEVSEFGSGAEGKPEKKSKKKTK
ncbi:MAG: DNA-directed RNA polymerase subunit alpha [bacterium]|nr:DNA-directed RNA polymerase subunit alpha [bacterium]